MAKPSIQNITTTQTFQNWLDKTNELTDIARDSAITASALNDITSGDATLLGQFSANTLIAATELQVDNITSVDAGNSVFFTSPVQVTPALSPIAIELNYGASGGRARFTDGTLAWDAGMDNSTNANFILSEGGEVQLSLSTAGTLTVASVVSSSDINGNNMTLTGDLAANTATFASANGAFSGTFAGNMTGDIFHPDGTKVFENGGLASAIPAQFTGNVLGTVSSLINHDTDSLAEGDSNLYYTDARARAAISGGTGVSYASSTGVVSIGQAVATTSNVTFRDIQARNIDCTDVDATGTVTANKFEGDGSSLTGIESMVKAYVAFNGATGAVIASKGLTVTKTATGNYTINILSGYRPPNADYAVVLGNVDEQVASRALEVLTTQVGGYNTYVESRSTNSFVMRATRISNRTVYQVWDDNNMTQTFGITTVDPVYVTAVLLFNR